MFVSRSNGVASMKTEEQNPSSLVQAKRKAFAEFNVSVQLQV